MDVRATKSAVEMVLLAVGRMGCTAPHPEIIRKAKHGDPTEAVAAGGEAMPTAPSPSPLSFLSDLFYR